MFPAENASVIPLRQNVDAGRVRGSIIQLHVDWLRDYGSREEIIDLFESLNPLLRHQVLAAQPAHWYRFATIVDLQNAIAARFANGDTRFVEHIGSYAARKQLLPLREYVDRSRLHDFLRTTAVLHRDTLDFGGADYEALAEEAGRMSVCGLADSPSYRAFLGGLYREVIAQHGAEATVRESVPGTFDLGWR